MRRHHRKTLKKIKQKIRKHLTFLEAMRLYAGMPVL